MYTHIFFSKIGGANKIKCINNIKKAVRIKLTKKGWDDDDDNWCVMSNQVQ